MDFMEMADFVETKGNKLLSAILPYALARSFGPIKKNNDPCGKWLSIASYFNNYHLQGGELIKTRSKDQKKAGGPTDRYPFKSSIG
jgi:hypothetical protein